MRKKVKQLKIAYFRDKVNSFPIIKSGTWKTKNGSAELIWCLSDGKRVDCHRVNSKRGKELVRLRDECENCKRILSKLESEWIDIYGTPCEPMKIKLYGNTENRRRFDAFKERCNTYESKNAVFYEGRKYKSKLEGDFAKLMDEYGIPFKYEPEVVIAGSIIKDPDFIIYLPWLDLLILVEIFGACDDVGYLDRNKLKLYNYMLDGWIPGWNMLAMYYTGKTPYVREMVMEDIENMEIRKCLAILNSGD